MIIGIPKETSPGERRVALVPEGVASLRKKGVEVLVEAGAGEGSGLPDAEYTKKEASVVASRAEIFARADVIMQVRTPGANPETGEADLKMLRSGQILIGLAEPLIALETAKAVAAAGVTSFALELMPRITRAQSMDVLSSMANIAGYKGVLMAANELPRIFPMMMTAAGTLKPAKVLVIGVGVAGLQAIATARRLGAVVQGYDVRPVVKEQVESLGAKFVDLGLETAQAQDAGGYAKEQSQDFYRRQQEALGKVVAANDVVITTALVPGKRAPVLVSAEMVKLMAPGSIVVDLAAERGGNCELTQPGETAVVGGVRIMGPLNLLSTVPNHASQLYSHNITTFFTHLIRSGEISYDLEDEITQQTLVTREGQVVHGRVKELMAPKASA
ncbi:MAG: Re/Si-specific NAD(P)(+) transhydrogenase subunit alpha [Candidatus Latescibacteria bacterium]|nr:Re/Si-specific NAD(P)(+) transhydrogenase subunit alpha [Candidatus Latescibacterota bacterium]